MEDPVALNEGRYELVFGYVSPKQQKIIERDLKEICQNLGLEMPSVTTAISQEGLKVQELKAKGWFFLPSTRAAVMTVKGSGDLAACLKLYTYFKNTRNYTWFDPVSGLCHGQIEKKVKTATSAGEAIYWQGHQSFRHSISDRMPYSVGSETSAQQKKADETGWELVNALYDFRNAHSEYEHRGRMESIGETAEERALNDIFWSQQSEDKKLRGAWVGHDALAVEYIERTERARKQSRLLKLEDKIIDALVRSDPAAAQVGENGAALMAFSASMAGRSEQESVELVREGYDLFSEIPRAQARIGILLDKDAADNNEAWQNAINKAALSDAEKVELLKTLAEFPAAEKELQDEEKAIGVDVVARLPSIMQAVAERLERQRVCKTAFEVAKEALQKKLEGAAPMVPQMSDGRILSVANILDKTPGVDLVFAQPVMKRREALLVAQA